MQWLDVVALRLYFLCFCLCDDLVHLVFSVIYEVQMKLICGENGSAVIGRYGWSVGGGTCAGRFFVLLMDEHVDVS